MAMVELAGVRKKRGRSPAPLAGGGRRIRCLVGRRGWERDAAGKHHRESTPAKSTGLAFYLPSLLEKRAFRSVTLSFQRDAYHV
jgi:hypothetical protein